MPAIAFTDQHERLKRTVSNALDGTTFESSRLEEKGRHFVVIARRNNGTTIGVRFRGIQKTPPSLVQGTRMRLDEVKTGGSSILRFIWPLSMVFRGPDYGYARVRIAAGAATLEVVCQDAEWWEEDAAPGAR